MISDTKRSVAVEKKWRIRWKQHFSCSSKWDDDTKIYEALLPSSGSLPTVYNSGYDEWKQIVCSDNLEKSIIANALVLQYCCRQQWYTHSILASAVLVVHVLHIVFEYIQNVNYFLILMFLIFFLLYLGSKCDNRHVLWLTKHLVNVVLILMDRCWGFLRAAWATCCLGPNPGASSPRKAGSPSSVCSCGYWTS